MTDDWQIKFCDFGRARYNDKGDKLKTQTLDSGIENVAYTAPEVYIVSSKQKNMLISPLSLGLYGWCVLSKDGCVQRGHCSVGNCNAYINRFVCV